MTGATKLIAAGLVLLAAGAFFFGRHRASPIPWRSDLQAAIADSQRMQRPIMVDFYADW